MTELNIHRQDAHAHAHAEARARRRRTDRLLTLDRALLVGIFAAGGWVASADLRHGSLQTRVEALEHRQETAMALDAQQNQEIAVIRSELRYIGDNLAKLAEATSRLVNRLRDSDGGR